jgi:hypothetical protein
MPVFRADLPGKEDQFLGAISFVVDVGHDGEADVPEVAESEIRYFHILFLMHRKGDPRPGHHPDRFPAEESAFRLFQGVPPGGGRRINIEGLSAYSKSGIEDGLKGLSAGKLS